jgi:hypothetical protein
MYRSEEEYDFYREQRYVDPRCKPRIRRGDVLRYFHSGRIDVLATDVREDEAHLYIKLKGHTFDDFIARRWASN